MGYVGANGDRLKLLSRRCEDAADELGHQRSRLSAELTAIGLSSDVEHQLAAIERWLQDQQRFIGHRADEADADRDGGHGSHHGSHHRSPWGIVGHAASSFGHGVWDGTVGLVKGAVGLAELMGRGYAAPIRMADALVEHGPSGLVHQAEVQIGENVRLVEGLYTEVKHLGKVANHFGPAGPIFFANDVRRHGLDNATSEYAYEAGSITPDLIVTAATMGGGEAGAAVDDIVVPRGFVDANAYRWFGRDLSSGLDAAGYPGTGIAVSGSAASGVKFLTGEPFDVGRLSDMDIALGGDDIFEAAKRTGVSIRSRGTRTGPLGPTQLNEMGLLDLSNTLEARLGRPVGFMVYRSIDAAIARRLSIPVPVPVARP